MPRNQNTNWPAESDKAEIRRLLGIFLCQHAEPYVLDAIHNPLLATGRCDGVANDVMEFLRKHSDYDPTDIGLVQLVGYRGKIKPYFIHGVITKDHHRRFMWHCVTYCMGWYIDLTGGQFHPEIGGLRIWHPEEIERNWHEAKTFGEIGEPQLIFSS